jgi:hypothetical protein
MQENLFLLPGILSMHEKLHRFLSSFGVAGVSIVVTLQWVTGA